MNKSFKKIIYTAVAVVMALSAVSCSKNTIEKSDNAVTTTTASKEETVTAAPEEEPTGGETQAKKTKKKKKVIKENYNHLTGLYDVSDDGKGKRPCAVMVNNIEAALPQYGIYDADILFEIVAEGGITRLMAVYGDESDIPNVCSVRSARYYYMLFAQSFDAVYLHWGSDPIICRPMFDELSIDHIDGMYNTDIYDRDYDRMNYMDMEHTGYLNGSAVMDEISALGMRQDIKDGYEDIFSFYDEFTKPAGDDCDKATVNFSQWYFSDFTYSDKTKTYKKLHNGNKHMDQVKNKQLEFTNLLILEVPDIKVANEDSKIVKFDMDGGSGYLLTGGKIKRINWSKDGDFGKLTLTDESGNDLMLNVGKTYIGVTKQGTLSY
ncbi:MAG: DUF3048 domain-containing protein [Ruminococcus sp.]|nr:DUF3048 domain-containing protein [Ruminococcus sp.]